MLRAGVELDAVHGRQILEHTPAAVTEPSIPIGSARDLSARMIVDDAALGHSERLARLR